MSAALKSDQKPMPEGVRLASVGDEAKLWTLCMTAFQDNGFGRLDETQVRSMLRKGCARTDGVVFAVVEGADGLEAVIGLVPTHLWYSSDWYFTDLMTFVHPDHRASGHAMKLLRFAKWWAHATGMHVELAIATDADQARKEKLFSWFGQRTGSAFLISPYDGAAPS